MLPEITAVCVLFEGGADTPAYSRGYYSPLWVDRLYRGLKRNTVYPLRMVCLTDREYWFDEPIIQQRLTHTRWQDVLLQAYGVEGERLAFMGLDTIITGNLDALFGYEGPLAVPIDPYRPGHACSGFVLCPPRPDLAVLTGNDMLALDTVPHDWLDDLYPGQVLSYKGQCLEGRPPDARVVYFHGFPKMSDFPDGHWVTQDWVRSEVLSAP